MSSRPPFICLSPSYLLHHHLPPPPPSFSFDSQLLSFVLIFIPFTRTSIYEQEKFSSFLSKYIFNTLILVQLCLLLIYLNSIKLLISFPFLQIPYQLLQFLFLSLSRLHLFLNIIITLIIFVPSYYHFCISQTLSP